MLGLAKLTCDLSLLFLLLQLGRGQHLPCTTRRPEGHSPNKRTGDGGFRLIVLGPNSSGGLGAIPLPQQGLYIPNEVYTVTIQGLKTRYSTQKFTEFLLVAESEKQAMMGPQGLVTTGIFHLVDDSQTRYSDICPDGVTSVNRKPKGEVSVLWTAPSKVIASCVTFKVTVVERPHVWYMDDGQLTKTLCPQMPTRPTTTAQTTTTTSTLAPRQFPQRPAPNFQTPFPSFATAATNAPGECCACDDAKYDIIFEGIWSKETHPKDFPENEWLLHFSDIIGASHSPSYYFWKEGDVASEGIRQVAEWGATRHLENELKGQSQQINTIIKARGLWHPNEKGSTSAAFRVDRRRHLMSLVSMIGPSPDWIVGISGLDLCLPNCTWIDERELDLFPYDAGTDSGITYMSPNTPTSPQGMIQALSPNQPDDSRSPFHGLQKIEPFAKVSIRRQRIYLKSCSDVSNSSGIYEPHTVIVAENSDDDSSRPECGVSEWTAWSECSVTCGKGLRMRKRSYTLPMKADMFRCDRQLVEKEMCLGTTPTCPAEDGFFVEEVSSICAVSPWGEWSPCSVSCGTGGTRTRSRRYKSHMGRKKCTLEMEQSEACAGTMETCPEVTTTLVPKVECPLSPWSEWSPCSVSCGTGYKLRTRLLLPPDDDPLPRECDRLQLSQRAECVGDYGAECSLSMGDAKELCSSPSVTGPCRAHKLRFYFDVDKGMCLPFTYGGCKGNRNRFENEAECNKACGFMRPKSKATESVFGAYQHVLLTTTPTTEATPTPSTETIQSSTREEMTTTATPTETMTSVFVAESEEEPKSSRSPTTTTAIPPESEESFNLDLASAQKYFRNTFGYVTVCSAPPPTSPPQVVDCVVSAWSTEWSPCSVSCGTGTRSKYREILTQPQINGRRCPRKLVKKKTCVMSPCDN